MISPLPPESTQDIEITYSMDFFKGNFRWDRQAGGERYFRWSHAPSGIHLARLVVNSSGHTVTSWPPCHWSM